MYLLVLTVFVAPKKPIKPSKPQALMGKKPAKFALEGNKWMIVRSSSESVVGQRLTDVTQEYQENVSPLTVDNVELNQTVNLFGCKNSTVIIKGKVNAITLGMLPIYGVWRCANNGH